MIFLHYPSDILRQYDIETMLEYEVGYTLQGDLN